jgi:thiol:disulfide interchange protein DsbD
MLVGVFAAPCIGPPVLALLAAVANNGNPQFGFTAFFIFSLGMGLPYLILGTFSSLITKLPKAGGWLIWVERVFGVILIGFAIFYLSLALHWNAPKVKQDANIWQQFSQTALEDIKKNHQPVIIDFFAEWCFGCRELDQNVFSKSEIQAKLSQVKTLRVDATDMDNPVTQGLIDQYSLIGLPSVIFLDQNGEEVKEARVEGSVPIDEFKESLDKWAMKANVTFTNTRKENP